MGAGDEVWRRSEDERCAPPGSANPTFCALLPPACHTGLGAHETTVGARPPARPRRTAGVFEGSLIRAVRRLEEALRQLEAAAAAAGEGELAAKFHAAGQSVKRDVVFAASLFL